MGFLHLGLIKTLVAILAIVLIGLAVEYLYVKKIGNRRKRIRSKVTLRNLLIIALIIFLAKIWVDGFGHFLALIGFVSAALTITQKENILNLTGWLIIMWRNAFSEGDYISIGQTSGIVKSLGVFYFTLEEISGHNYSEKTGKIIKVPNSHISLHPFTTYQIEHFVVVEEAYYFSFDTEISRALEFKKTFEQTFSDYIHSLEIRFTHDEKREYQKIIKRYKNKNPIVGIKAEQKTTKGYKLSIRCYCLIQDQIEVRDYLNALILKITSEQPGIYFATDYR